MPIFPDYICRLWGLLNIKLFSKNSLKVYELIFLNSFIVIQASI